MEQCKYLCCQTILMEESRQHSGNILYKGKITSDSFIRREISKWDDQLTGKAIWSEKVDRA